MIMMDGRAGKNDNVDGWIIMMDGWIFVMDGRAGKNDHVYDMSTLTQSGSSGVLYDMLS